ncbi:MAG: acylphosphatase [Marivibrio sp.]|uniref:acylphosphatase n=1 Tax=Marivibrio sp. TaxID=2039719 RepID=UPI0032EEA54F
MTDDSKTIHAIISGKVQGVWFRAWTQETAEELGLDGWVRNRRDGTVEAVFSGPSTSVDRMVELAHDGPSHARVRDVQVSDSAETPTPGFEKRPTV